MQSAHITELRMPFQLLLLSSEPIIRPAALRKRNKSRDPPRARDLGTPIAFGVSPGSRGLNALLPSQGR